MPVIIDKRTIGTTTNLSKLRNISPIGLIYSFNKFKAPPALPPKIDASSIPPSTLIRPRITPIISPAKILIDNGNFFFFSIVFLPGSAPTVFKLLVLLYKKNRQVAIKRDGFSAPYLIIVLSFVLLVVLVVPVF